MITRRRKTLRSPRKAHRLRRRRLALSVLSVLLVAGVFGGVWYLLSLPVFTIEEIEIRGTHALSGDEISLTVQERLTGNYLGIIPRRSVFFYPQAELAKALPEKFLRLQKSEFRMLSSSVLTVFVTERLAVARLCNTACFLMDETGLLFAEAEGTSTAQLLRIRVPGGDIAPGFQFLDGERLIALLGFAGTLRTIGFGVSELSVNGEELVVRLQSGARILLHLEKQYGTIERHLQALVAEKDLFAKGAGSIETLEYIDLRYGNKIYFKPK